MPGGRAPALGPRAGEILALGRAGGSAALDLPGGLRAVVEYGRLRFAMTPDPGPPAPGSRAPDRPAPGPHRPGSGARRSPGPGRPAPALLPVPGRAAFAGGVLTSERGPALAVGGEGATLDAATLAPPLQARAWQAGDRMRPLGLGGSRSLADLFADRKVPRARRGTVPVVVSAGEVAWVPGVAVGERFRVTAGTEERVRLGWDEGAAGRA